MIFSSIQYLSPVYYFKRLRSAGIEEVMRKRIMNGKCLVILQVSWETGLFTADSG
jgi:hypothetical protein